MTEIVPAILTNDEADFRLKYSTLLPLGQYFKRLHIDFIDGEYLPNKTLMPEDLTFLRTPLVLVAHFMTFNPQQYFADAKKVGFKVAVIHHEAFESDEQVSEALNDGVTMGLGMGLAINPGTPLHRIAKMLGQVKQIQIMGVHPGAQGRNFEPEALEKISELKSLTRNVIISVDGGIKPGVAAKCARAGADYVIIGSAILNATHPKDALEMFKKELEST
jgi:ribulose-phosphate 3-epimerase